MEDETVAQPEVVVEAEAALPPLEPGDHLTRDEFERRYGAMPGLKKAELIEGVVYMASPVRLRHHGRPHSHISTWLGTYEPAFLISGGLAIAAAMVSLLIGRRFVRLRFA